MHLNRFLIVLTIIAVLPGNCAAFINFLNELLHNSIWLPLTCGLLIGSVLDRRFVRRIPKLHTAEHELIHAAAAVLMLRRVQSIRIGSDSGHVMHSGSTGGLVGSDFIGFAPYIIPATTCILVSLRPFIGHAVLMLYDVTVGMTLGHYLSANLMQLSIDQPDIRKRGVVYSTLFILAGMVIVYGILLACLLHGYKGFSIWAHIIFVTSKHSALFLSQVASGWMVR